MNKPVKGKLTCKGNVPTKLAAKGIDSATLFHYTQGLDVADFDGVQEKLQDVADIITNTLIDAGYGPVFDSLMGGTYMAEYNGELVDSLLDIALGTAVQGRAFKRSVCNETDAEMSDFASDGKAKAVKKDEVDPFADLA